MNLFFKAQLKESSTLLVEGVFYPEQIFYLIKEFGINLFDSSYAVWLAENGKALKIGTDFPNESTDYQIVDFNDKR